MPTRRPLAGPGGRRPTRRLRLEFVADTPDGLDVARAHGVRLDLLAQASDVDGHGAAVAEMGVVPDVVEELFAGEDLTRARRQEVQQIELLGGQLDRPPGQL